MTCPICGGRDLGRIAPDHYYCWNCFVEVAHEAGELRAFSVDLDGVLTPVGADGGAASEQPGEGYA
ncbi:MAG TPA: hypothetical protein VNM16_01040 [Bacillota bacterium]|nr:hypothetical protein [Bacillota bacterium]